MDREEKEFKNIEISVNAFLSIALIYLSFIIMLLNTDVTKLSDVLISLISAFLLVFYIIIIHHFLKRANKI